jgi:hypothetical protein
LGGAADAYLAARTRTAAEAEARLGRLRRGGRGTPAAAFGSTTGLTRVQGLARLRSTGRDEVPSELAIDIVVSSPPGRRPDDATIARAVVEGIGDAVAARIAATATESPAAPSSALDRIAAVTAVRAASGRPITPLVKLGDAHGLAPPTEGIFAVRLPADSAQRCFAFVAAARTGTVARLELGTLVGTPAQFVAMARDGRGERTAGFDLCALAAGDYVVRSLHDDVTAVRVFDTTPRSEPVARTSGPAATIEARPAARPSIEHQPTVRETAFDRCVRACQDLDDGSNQAVTAMAKCRSECKAQ